MKKVKKSLKKLLKLLENHLGLVILIIFVIIILYASWIFYKFVYKPIYTPSEISFEKVEIKKAIFEKVTEQIELREENILEAAGKGYKDVFK